jgi:hypothetical protein
MAGRAVGEGGCASEDQLLGLRVADDDGIVVAAVDSCISIARHIIHYFGHKIKLFKLCGIRGCYQDVKGYSSN